MSFWKREIKYQNSGVSGGDSVKKKKRDLKWFAKLRTQAFKTLQTILNTLGKNPLKNPAFPISALKYTPFNHKLDWNFRAYV